MNSVPRRYWSTALWSLRRCNLVKQTCVCATHPLPKSERSFSTSKTGQEHHAFFQEQLEEIEKDRKSFFGEGDADGINSPVSELDGQQQDAFFAEEIQKLEQERKEFFGENSQTGTAAPKQDMAQEHLEQMHFERESLFEFNAEEKQAWSQADFSSSGGKVSAQRMQEIAEARAAVERGESQPQQQTTNVAVEEHHPSFSHVSQEGDSVHMVDVGHKKVTTRMAHAQTKVILPNEVLEAFARSGPNELVGPKGPILATAKLAGIMAAKKTSDLIPLCHPLPLDQVKIDIRLLGNEVIIDCTCRVTHKTGVEMEALTGATVAALTVYDMVKAVSHQVQITDTRLIAKTGGKRTVPNDRK